MTYYIPTICKVEGHVPHQIAPMAIGLTPHRYGFLYLKTVVGLDCTSNHACYCVFMTSLSC